MTSVHRFVSGLDLRKIRHMVALAEHGSFGRAADAVCISQSALSRSIQSLESSLGVELFDRTERRVTLTPAGKLSIDAAQDILRSAAEFYRTVDSASASEIGELRIGLGSVTSSLFGPPLLRRYAKRFPKLKLTLRVGAPENLFGMLLGEDLDLVIGNADALPNSHTYGVETIARFSRGFFARADHPLSNMQDLSIDALSRYMVGATYPLPPAIEEAIEAIYGVSSIEKCFRIRSNHYGALIDLMMNDDAIVFGCKIAYLEELSRGSIALLDVTPEFVPDMPLIVARPAGRSISPVERLLSDVLREVIAGGAPDAVVPLAGAPCPPPQRRQETGAASGPPAERFVTRS